MRNFYSSATPPASSICEVALTTYGRKKNERNCQIFGKIRDNFHISPMTGSSVVNDWAVIASYSIASGSQLGTPNESATVPQNG